MALCQRGRRAPQGISASNLSITDISYTAWTDMKWGILCMDSLMLLDMGIHQKTTQVHGELMFIMVYPKIVFWL